MHIILAFLFLFHCLFSSISFLKAMDQNIPVITSDNYTVALPASLWKNSRTLCNMIENLGSSSDPIPLPLEQSALERLKNCFTLEGKINKEHLKSLSSFERETLPYAVAFLDITKLEKPLAKYLKNELKKTFAYHQPLPPSFEARIRNVLKKEILPNFNHYHFKRVLKLPGEEAIDYQYSHYIDDYSFQLDCSIHNNTQTKKIFNETTRSITSEITHHVPDLPDLPLESEIESAVKHNIFPTQTEWINNKNIIAILNQKMNRIGLFHSHTYELLKYLEPSLEESKEIRRIISNPPGKYLAAYNPAVKKVWIWNIESEKLVRILPAASLPQGPLALHPTQSLIAIPATATILTIWNFLEGTTLQNISYNISIDQITFSPSGNKLALIEQDIEGDIEEDLEAKLLTIEVYQNNTPLSLQFLEPLTLFQLLFIGALQKAKTNKETNLYNTYKQLGNNCDILDELEELRKKDSSLALKQKHRQNHEVLHNHLIKKIHTLKTQLPPSLKSPFMMQSLYYETIFNSLPQTIQNYLIENNFVKKE